MSYNTSSGLPFESRQYRCERHPLSEDPIRCSTCEYNRSQRQADRERADAARTLIDLATREYSSSPHRRNLEQDIARSGITNYGELRNSARDPLYGAEGSASETYYRSYDSRAAYPTGSSSFRDPFERDRNANRGQDGRDFRWENSASSNQTTVRYAELPPPNSQDPGSLGSRRRRDGLSGNSGGGWSTSQCPQQ